jgi:transcriptional regulator with XRE-family HTH domain
MESEFTMLENKTIGRNIYKFRKIREKKAFEVADYIGISEPAYTKYERGESKITIELIQKVAEFLQVDPLQIIASQPGHIIENVTNSPFAIHGTVTTTNEEQTQLITKLVENVMAMNEKIIALLEKK